jgi:hypothetical protein
MAIVNTGLRAGRLRRAHNYSWVVDASFQVGWDILLYSPANSFHLNSKNLLCNIHHARNSSLWECVEMIQALHTVLPANLENQGRHTRTGI